MADGILTVAIIEDQREIREGLRRLIDMTPGFRCAAVFRSMEEALASSSSEVPQVVLVDIGLPGLSGIDGIPLLRKKYPAGSMLMLTVYDDDDRIFRALCAGACGYLLKKTPPVKLLESIREVNEGGAPMSPEIARRVIALFRDVYPPEKADYDLTPHELRVLKLLAEGHSYKTAADQLGVSIHTISFHTRLIYQKLHVHSKSEAVARALRGRLLR